VLLATDYWREIPLACGVHASCRSLLRSGYGQAAGIPLPLIGCAHFAALYLVSFSRQRDNVVLVRLLARIGFLVAIYLIFLQVAVLRTVCALCVVTNLCAAAIGVLLRNHEPTTEPAPRLAFRHGLLLTLAVGFPVATLAIPTKVPLNEGLRAYWASGVVNVLEITNPNCPYCRTMHRRLNEALEGRTESVRRQVLIFPLSPEEIDLAAGGRCLEKDPRWESVVDRLFQRERTGREDLVQAAEASGVDISKLEACWNDAQIEAVRGDLKRWRPSVVALPMIWIQDEALSGLRTVEEIRERLAFHEAILAKSQSR